MKTFILTIILMCSIFYFDLQANILRDTTNKYNFYFNIGFSYIPFVDNIAGPLIGLSLSNPKKSLGFFVRTDFLISIGSKLDVIDTSAGFSIPTYKYGLLKYNNIVYGDIEYNLSKVTNIPLTIGLGYGWIYLGERENFRFNRDYGYAVLSPKLIYQYSWILFELRGNIQLQKEYFQKYYNYKRLFPIEISLIYRFAPK